MPLGMKGQLIGTLATDLPGVWHCKVYAGTGWPGVRIRDRVRYYSEFDLLTSPSVWQHTQLL